MPDVRRLPPRRVHPEGPPPDEVDHVPRGRALQPHQDLAQILDNNKGKRRTGRDLYKLDQAPIRFGQKYCSAIFSHPGQEVYSNMASFRVLRA